MKKGIIALLVVLALIVMISPGIIGMLAEKSVDEQIEWAKHENQDLVITAERFDRGWFSSEGRHRIELGDPANAPVLRDILGLAGADAVPALIIDTELYHGPIALASFADENLSFVPGLGIAVSELSVETSTGEIIELPGRVYSMLAIGGDLHSILKVSAGTQEAVTWSKVRVDFKSIAASGDYTYDGMIESLHVEGSDEQFELSNMSFSGDLKTSEFGFAIGDMHLSFDNMSVKTGPAPPTSMGPFVFDTTSSVSDGRLNSSSELKLTIDSVPNLGQIELDTRVSIGGVDGAALNLLVQGMQTVQTSADPAAAMSAIETELLGVLAAGADLQIERLDLSLPAGTIKSAVNVKFLESDSTDFGWASLLLALEADARLEIPEVIAGLAMAMSPQASVIEGFLRKNGDVYEMEAAYKQGLLTVNGMPLPLPIP